MRTILQGYTFGKTLYPCQMTAQALHFCVPAQARLDVKTYPRHQQAESSAGSTLQASWKLTHLFPPLWIRRRFWNGLVHLRHDLNAA